MAKKRIAQEAKSRANTRTLRRIIILMAVLGAAVFLPLFGQLYALQIVQHDELEQVAIDQQTKDIEVSASRGTIFDRNGATLAISASVHNVVLSPMDIEKNKLDKERIAYGLAPIIGAEAEALLARMERTNSAYEVVARKVEEDVSDAVRGFIAEYNKEVEEYNKGKQAEEKKAKLTAGLYLMPDTKRYYPYSELAAQVIGFVGTDNYGLYGMEELYNTELEGSSGRVVTARSGNSTELPFRYEDMYDPVPGSNLHLTLDTTIQYVAEKVLAEGIEEFEAQQGGFCIVMDPNTGAILAYANSPDYDLNNPSAIADENVLEGLALLSEEEYPAALGQAQLNQWRNKALSDTYEPGSTFKSMVLSMALEEGVVDEHTSFYCSGSVQIGGYTIRCHKRDGHGSQTLSQAVENSCNPAFIAIGQKVGAERFYQYLEDYGFLDITGVDMQGEVNSIIWSRDYFTGAEGYVSLATASFGQTMKVSPMQLITAACAAVNGGHLMQPYVLDKVTSPNGSVLSQTQPIEVRQVISEETSAQVRTILERVVGTSTGTGKNAYQPGYRIGGKTGTSQKRDEDSGNVIVSFLGFAPADDPQIVVLLAYDSPKPTVKGGNYTSRNWYISGGNMGALKAGPLIADILDYLGVEKQYSAAELGTADTLVPNVVGQTAESAKALLAAKGFDVRVIGAGDTVESQVPASGAAIPGGSRVNIYFGDSAPQESVTVPSVIGYGPEYARQVLQNAGLYMKTTGIADTYTVATVAAGQSLDSGTEVKPGTVVEVHFIDKTLTD